MLKIKLLQDSGMSSWKLRLFYIMQR